MKALLSNFEIDDFPNKSMRMVAKKLGVHFAKELMTKCGGSIIYVPSRFTTRFCRRYIERHFDGHNHDKMAEDLDITPRSVYRYLDSKI